MKQIDRVPRRALALGVALSLALLGGAHAAELKLSGDNEVPAVKTMASGSGEISVAPDGAVSGSIKTVSLSGTAAHIHAGAAGTNGPVAIPLVKGTDGVWSVPPGAKLTAEQMKGFKAGALYVNVHSDTNKGGEIRAQLIP